jgi:hypothetical protein
MYLNKAEAAVKTGDYATALAALNTVRGRSLTRLYPGPHNAVEEILPTDYRVIYFIPQTAIDSYTGTLTQNPTSN